MTKERHDLQLAATNPKPVSGDDGTGDFQGLIQFNVVKRNISLFGGLKRKLLLEAEVLLSGLLLLGLAARLLLCTPASDEAAIAELSSVEHR